MKYHLSKKRSFVTIVALALCFFLLGCSYSQPTTNEIYTFIATNTFKVKFGKKLLGTAFAISYEIEKKKYLVLLTANHVVNTKIDTIPNLELVKGNISFPIDSIATPDGVSDFAVVFSNKLFEYYSNGTDQFKYLKELQTISDRDLAKDLIVVHNSEYDDLNQTLVSKGYIEALKNDLFMIYAPLIAGGASGSPVVLNETGKVIGILIKTKINKKTDTYTGLSSVIYAKDVLIALKRFIQTDDRIKNYPIESTTNIVDI